MQFYGEAFDWHHLFLLQHSACCVAFTGEGRRGVLFFCRMPSAAFASYLIHSTAEQFGIQLLHKGAAEFGFASLPLVSIIKQSGS